MIDVSDGLGADAGHLARAGDVGLRIDAESIPLSAAAREASEALGQDPWQLLAGGEDYELLACLPPERIEEATEAVRGAEAVALTRIGEVVAGSGVEIRLPGGELADPGGFDQLA